MKVNESSNVLREEAFDIENPEVSVATVSSNVKVLESMDGKCHVEVFGKSESAKHVVESVEIASTGRTLSVRVDKNNRGLRGLFSGGSADLLVVVSLPKLSALKVKTVSADVEVNQTLLSIEIGSVSGNIGVLHNPAGSCVLKTVSGDISTHTFSSCQYSLKSVSGDIRVHVAPGLEVDVDGKTVSGDLESEISLNSNNDAPSTSSELVTISTSTVSGDFTLARN